MRPLLLSLLILFSALSYAGAPPMPVGDEESKIKIPTKTASDKFLYITNVGIDFKKDNGVEMYYLTFAKSDKDPTIESKITYAETHRSEQEEEQKKSEAKKKSGPEKEKLNKEEDNVEQDYTTLGHELVNDTMEV